jgi:SAM-dependent methyltransferase
MEQRRLRDTEDTQQNASSRLAPSCPICHDPNQAGTRLKCEKCGNGDRTRTLHYAYQSLQKLTATRSALIFTAESWLPGEYFAMHERSIFGGHNHLDIQNIQRASESYSWISCNHVLEHVPDDRRAILEMFRVLRYDGVLQLTIPAPSRTSVTVDWQFPDPRKTLHYRNYGADFTEALARLIPSAHIIIHIIRDKLTPFIDTSYLIFKDPKIRMQCCEAIFAAGDVCVLVPNIASKA